jgi:hypothetical protein
MMWPSLSTSAPQLYTAQGYEIHERNEAATWRGEFYSLQLADGTHVQYGSLQGAQGQYLTIEGTLRQIVESFHVGTISGMTTAVYSPITLTETTLFTHTAHSYTLQYPIGLHLLSNFGIESDISFATKPDAGSPLDLSPADFWVSVAQEDNPDGLSLSQWAEGLVKLGEARSVTVAGEPAFQISWNLREAGDSHNGFAIVTYVAREGQIYRFTGLAETADALAYYTPAYQLLLDTFQFLP